MRSRIQRFCHYGAYPVACCAAVLLCVTIANPFVCAGFVDDWSYSHLALRFAETGHIKYEGWGSPTLLFQGLWGAAWIHLVGFSFNLMRVISIPFALGFVLLIYATGRKVGLRRDLAFLGALIVGTAPLFLPLAASFMTESYGCFFCALCIYAAISSAEAQSDSMALFWLWILGASGIMGGSDRQVVWIAPLSLIPYLCWLRRLNRRFCMHAIALYVLCVAGLAFLSTRFAPPYAPFALRRDQIWTLVIHDAPLASAILLGLFLTTLLISLPAFLCFSLYWKALGSTRLFIASLVSVAVVALLIAGVGQLGVVPFSIGILSHFGILPKGTDALGFKPVVLHPALRIFISALVPFSAITCGLLEWKSASFLPTARAVFAIFSFFYVALLLPGAFLFISFDRYVLPLVPCLVLLVLHRFQRHASRVPAIAWICVSVFAMYAVLITHDYASSSRARVQAAQVLQKQGVRRSHVSAGFEYDGWTQLEEAGSVRGSTYHDAFEWNNTDRFWFWHHATALRPDYVVSISLGPASDDLLSVPFTSWFPPFRRFAIVQRRQDLPKGPVCNTLLPCYLP